MAGAITNLKDKRCPCGVVFTPNSGRQKYHSEDCPSRKTDAQAKTAAKSQAKPATAKAARKPARPKAVVGNGNTANGNGNGHKPAGPEILGRLIGDCDRELESIDAELRPLLELQARRAQVAKVRDTLASV